MKGMGEIPELPAPASRRDQFRDEAREAWKTAFDAIEELHASVADMKVSQKQKDELTKRANSIEARLTSSLPFVLDQFGEHMETTVERAKTEFEVQWNGKPD